MAQTPSQINNPLSGLDYKNLQSGLIMQSAVGKSRLPLDCVIECVNMHFDTIGVAKLRAGLTLLGDQLSGNILGLYEFRDSGSGTNNQIITVNGSTAYYLSSGGTWTSIRSSLTSTSKARFTTFLDVVIMVNGTESTVQWNGNPSQSFSTSTTQVSGAPIGKYIENFRSRVWIAGQSTYPDRLFYSSLPSSVTAPVITWDTSVTTGQWIDISPSDGENITALKRTKGSLLVFKQNHIYRVYTISETEPDPKINVGTRSQESVVEAKDGTYFWHDSGPYRYRDGGIDDLGQPIVDVVENVSLSNLEKVAGWEDGNHVYFSLGNVTIKGTTFNNVVMRYTISTQVWTMYSYPQQFLTSSPYNDGTTLFKLVGDDNGNVLKVNVGLTDNGTGISYSLIHRPYTLDGFYTTRKNVQKMIFVHDGGAGTNVNWKDRYDPASDFSKSVIQLDHQNTQFKGSIKGTELTFRISGSSSGQPFTYEGFEVVEASSEIFNR